MTHNTPNKNMCDDARLNVLYSPFRKRDVNPQDWDSKMIYWKNTIKNWCINTNILVFSLVDLQSEFKRNERPAACLITVVDNMLRSDEIIKLEELLSRDPSIQSWSTWAVNCLVKAPVLWSFSKVKESLIQKSDCPDEKFVYIDVLKEHSNRVLNEFKNRAEKSIVTLDEIKSSLDVADNLTIKVVLHWLQLQKLAAVRIVGGETVVKLSTDNRPVAAISDTDVGLLRLQQNLQALTRTLVQLEEEKQEAEQEARTYVKKGMRQAAKSCLRKKKELEKCIDKRASALENVHVLLSRVKEAESDAEILNAYNVGLSAIKTTFKEAGLSEDSVCNTMDQVKEVLEVHEEIQSALSEPMADSLDQDLEEELADLLSSSAPVLVRDTLKQISLIDLPEPPSNSPKASKETTSTRRVAQSLLQ